MDRLRRRSFFLGGIAFTGTLSLGAFGKSESEKQFFFTTDEFAIRMNLEYYDEFPDSGLRFEDRAADRRYCLSAEGQENKNCINNFKGSIAVAQYHISPRRGEGAGSPSMREYVRSIDQSDHIPVRPPFERVIEVRSGRASDIQVFGYKEDRDGAAKADQPDDAWCLLRQNLYLERHDEPFLVLHWKHSIGSIRVLDIIPENGTRLVTHRS